MNFDGTNKVKIRLPDEVKNTPATEDDDNVNNARTQSLPTGNSMKKARSINLQEYLEQNLVGLKEQLNNYQEVCARFSAADWDIVDIADYLYVLIKSLSFDAFSVMLLDQSRPGHFLPMVSRGYQQPPTLELEQFWGQCLVPGEDGIEWSRLLELTQQEKSPLVSWMENQGIHRIGYSPIQDGNFISGFMIIASYEDKRPSPLASILLELCSGHIGLAMTARKFAKTTRISAATQDSPRDLLIMLKSMLQGIAEAESLTVDDLLETMQKGQAIIDDVLVKIK